ncbi:hypothetical protein LB572_16235 [Mesorhizobium sp. BH1-1-5]|uniref:hypothetical protein n=1 Tax=Mesorhizobium sp. BH1-1-5 TaxID=2876661 RepID=UPI001CCB42E6|nr:hypothetical protein [Mesorhizobium sp. BH1-1-5]MBZ9988647.1 hypothetical protein [Mesorhizobium sp. BH1-1-5]
MRRDTILGALTAINLLLLAGIVLTQVLPARAQDQPGILRGSGLQIVDGQGRVRSSISILPAKDGQAETVLFRLITEDGQPSVKIAASSASAGLSFVGGNDESYVILDADGPKTRLRMVEPQGAKS